MSNYLILIGLLFDIVGVSIIVHDDLKAYAARLRQSTSKPTGGCWAGFAFWLAKKSGSTDPQDTETYIAESYPKRLFGFICLFLGFIGQAIAVIINFMITSRCR